MIASESIAPPLTFRIVLDAAETVRATRDLRRVRGRLWLSRLLWAMFALVAAMYMADGARFDRWRLDLWRLGLAAFLFVVGELTPPLVHRWQLQRLYARTPMLREPRVYTFSDQGVTISGGPTSTSLGWDAFVRAGETREFFFLFYHPARACYLPKRVVGPDDEAGLRALIDSRVGLPAAKR